MAGSDNLKVPTSTEARRNGQAGGIASGRVRRERKAMKDTLGALLTMPLNDEAVTDIEEIQSIAGLNGKNITVQEAIMLAQIKKAVKGDTKAAEYIRDTSGNKLKEAIELSGAVSNPFAGLTTEELKKLAGDE